LNKTALSLHLHEALEKLKWRTRASRRTVWEPWDKLMVKCCFVFSYSCILV